ncbi:radical SAM/SPASM domain-containing protein [Aerosakkonema funiforme]|uniref:radical SAM/SPASM domain-containing protein n=1 Tax=Aerosakkonema funiforme TaxID=1246630 RepID=UPI0035B7A2A8
MNPFLSNIRLKWFLATRALDYSADFVKILYQIYLNHNKIIHFRNGYPVYSLSTPALFSKPASNFIARALYRTIQNKNLPNLMSFAVNDICNATCEHCSFFNAVEEKSINILTLRQAQKLIKDAQELGVSVINFVGGEPLLHKELPEIIKAVNKDFSTTILFTNGWHLEQRAAELKKAGLDSIYISIDAANPEKHDRFRNQPGLFDKAMRGIQTAKKLGFSVGISTTMTPESYRDGELDRIVKLGKKIGIHEVLVFDALPTGRYKERQDLVDNNDWIEEMIQSARKYNQNPNYPGVVFFAYFTSHRSVGCSCGTSYFYVSPYGDIMSCDFNHAKFGNILEEPLWKIWDRLTTLPEFCQAKWGGCKIKDSEFRQKETVSGGNLNIHI